MVVVLVRMRACVACACVRCGCTFVIQDSVTFDVILFLKFKLENPRVKKLLKKKMGMYYPPSIYIAVYTMYPCQCNNEISAHSENGG